MKKTPAPEKTQPEKPTSDSELQYEQEEEEQGEATIDVKKFEFKGQVYLRSSDDVLYDIKTQDPVGMWNEEEQCIDEIDIEED